MNPEQQFPFKEDEEGTYLILKTTEGVFELRPYNTFIFEPSDIAMRGLRHVYHATDETEEENRFEGFYMWKSQFEKAGHDFDMFVQELKDNDYHTEIFDEPHPDDLKAYRQAHEEEFKPETIQEIADKHEPSKLFEKIVEAAMNDFEAKASWYLGEWEQDNGSQS